MNIKRTVRVGLSSIDSEMDTKDFESQTNGPNMNVTTGTPEDIHVHYSVLTHLILKCVKDVGSDLKAVSYHNIVWQKFIENLYERTFFKKNQMVFNLFNSWCLKYDRDEENENDAYEFLLELYHVFKINVTSRAFSK
jgi:hypothetical protein